MPIDLSSLKSSPRVLIEARLRPVAGTRIQPTGFPDLGAALYEDPNGVPTLLVESAQSMANRLELVCWDEGNDRVVSELEGVPYVRVHLPDIGGGSTVSLLEFHRLNSPYIMSGVTSDGERFNDVLSKELGLAPAKSAKKAKKGEDAGDNTGDRTDVAGTVNLRKLAAVCFKYDPNSLVHGVFLEKIAGRLRHPRALSAFIEASGVGRADSGGVKLDRVLPKPSVAGVDAKGGYGNVPFHRTEFTARDISAFFSLDLAQLRGYGLGEDATRFLIVFSLWKVRRFLDSSMRLRSACELALVDPNSAITCKQPEGFTLPADQALSAELKQAKESCLQLFAKPTVTELTWKN